MWAIIANLRAKRAYRDRVGYHHDRKNPDDHHRWTSAVLALAVYCNTNRRFLHYWSIAPEDITAILSGNINRIEPIVLQAGITPSARRVIQAALVQLDLELQALQPVIDAMRSSHTSLLAQYAQRQLDEALQTETDRQNRMEAALNASASSSVPHQAHTARTHRAHTPSAVYVLTLSLSLPLSL